MNNIVFRLAKKLRPELETMNGQQQISSTADVLSLLYLGPLAVLGLIWLYSVSNWNSIREFWYLYLLIGVILIAFNRLRFFFITEIRAGGYANSDGTLDGIGVWAAILLLGPTALWLKVILDLGTYFISIIRERTTTEYWNRSRLLAADVAADILPTLVALVVYLSVGGSIPIKDFSIESIGPAFFAVIVQFVGIFVVYSGYIAYVLWSLKHVLHTPLKPAISFFFIAITLPTLANPFGILAAGIFAGEGILEFLFIMIGLLLTALLARRFSQAAEYSRQQSNQLEQLEKLGRAILDAPPDASKLAEVLHQHVSTMFASRGILIWSESKGELVHEPASLTFATESSWKWLQKDIHVVALLPKEKLPWDPASSYLGPAILCPIIDNETGLPIGEVFIELQTMNIPWDSRSLRGQIPAVQSLAAQIASAIHQSNVYIETLNMQKTLQELSIARTIQDSFLPEGVPELKGWQISATLEPARQVAGDFYDFIHLPKGKLGLLIADVADKGLGAALYMALSSTLIRIFAIEYPTHPAMILRAVNQHILRNARANLFVTVFLGVLDPNTGRLIYANAGHNPPYLFGTEDGVRVLNSTGMPLGIDENNSWFQEELMILPGEKLLMYTDGVTDAQNHDGVFIDRKMIAFVAQQNIKRTTQDILESIMDRLHHFMGDAPRFDDITLVILGRNDENK
jgi:serine phosphatase RsbU (regulator of sigma subunit)